MGIKIIVIGVNPRDESIARTILEKYDGVEIKLSRSRGAAGCLKDILTPKVKKGIVLYGDIVYLESIGGFNEALQRLNIGWAVIGVQQTNCLKNFMAIIENCGKYLPVIKPHGYEKGLAYIGLFGFNDPLILNKLFELEFSSRGELELTDLIKIYAELNALELGFYNFGLVDCNTKELATELLSLLKLKNISTDNRG